MKITTGDIFSYDAMQTLLEAITAQSPKAVRWRNVPVDYVKSAPYLLSFSIEIISSISKASP